MASHATTVRPSSNALLLIDSEDRFKDYNQARAAGTLADYNASPYNFTITKNQSLMNGSFTRIAVTEVTMPWGLPNINAKTDEILFSFRRVGADPATVTITLDPGFYTPTALAAALSTEMSQVLPGTIVTYGTSVPAFTFTAPAGYELSLDPLPYNSAAYPFPATSKQLYDILGLHPADAGNFASSIQGNFTFAQAVRYVDIVCPQLSYNQAVKDTMSQTIARDSLCRIYLGDAGMSGSFADGTFCPPGCAPTVIHRQFNPAKYIQWDPTQPVPGFLQFQVYDDTGAILGDLGSFGSQLYFADWSITMQISEH